MVEERVRADTERRMASSERVVESVFRLGLLHPEAKVVGAILNRSSPRKDPTNWPLGAKRR